MCLFVPKDLGNRWTDMVVIYVNLLIDPEKAYNFFWGEGVEWVRPFIQETSHLKIIFFFFLN